MIGFSRALRDLVLLTSPLLGGFYENLYRAGLWLAVATLRRDPAVVAVYLTGSMVQNRIVPGFSDIDLIVVFEGSEETRERIDRRIWWLGRLIPPLVYRERSIFELRELRDDFRGDLFLQYKLSGPSGASRLIFGRDVLADLDRTHSETWIADAVVGRAMFLWAQVIKMFFTDEQGRDPKKTEYNLGKLRAESRALGQSEPGPVEHSAASTYEACARDIRKALSATGWKTGAASASRYVLEERTSGVFLSSRNRDHLAGVVSSLEGRFGNEVRSLHVSPFQVLGIEEDNICVYARIKNEISLDMARELGRLLQQESGPQKLRPFLLTDEVAFSINWKDDKNLLTALTVPRVRPEIYLFLCAPESLIWGESYRHPVHEDLRLSLALRVQEWAGGSENKIRELLRRPTLVRLPNLDFQSFFWQALQLKSVTSKSGDGRASIPVSSKDVCARWSSVESWIAAFHEDFLRDLSGERSRSEAHFAAAVDFLRRAYEVR